MSPTLHPSEDLLIEHAAGRLTAGRDLVVAAHVAVCAQCFSEVRRGEDLGGALLEAEAPSPMSTGALDVVLAKIDRSAPAEAAPRPAIPAGWIDFPSPAVEAAYRRRRWAAPGVWVAPVIRGPGAVRTYLLRVGAGMSVPRHTHRGAEMVTVLEGAFDDRGLINRPGDFSANDDSVAHKPAVTADGPCVCLVCADRPLVPLDWVGKLFQPFVRI